MRKIFYVLSTHWDREWYQSFQDYRYRLVQLIDRVIEGLESGRLQGPFMTDAQSILIEDYLEIRPERREQVRELLRQRKIVTGPWYVLPDEFLVSGESLVRNIRRGREVARAHGAEPSNAGFVCDMFGQTSQLPQIFAGFGIRAGFIWRGTNTVENRHLVWKGADGTELPCYRFGQGGYCSFAFAVRKAMNPEMPFDEAAVAQRLEDFIRFEGEHTSVDPILLFDGADHLEWNPRVYEVLQKRGGIQHASLDEYMAEFLPQANRIGTRLEGELREPSKYPGKVDEQWVIPGVYSSRVWIKQSNAECQSLLCHWAEPFSSFAPGADYPAGYLDVAWKWLLTNHPHDSICGCSIDEVHEDMKYRFSQCRQIANRLTVEATRTIAAAVQGEVRDRELRVSVFNPIAKPIDEVVDLTLQIPSDWPSFNEFFGFEPKPAFRMFDEQGREIPYQRIAQTMQRKKYRTNDKHFTKGYQTNDTRVAVRLKVPATGYATIQVKADESWTRHPEVPGLVTSDRSMENEILSVRVESNGSVSITDKRSGQTYAGLMTFEERADIGDGWYHGVAVNDQIYHSTAAASDVAVIYDGPLAAAFRIRTNLKVPAEFEFDRMARSEKFVELVIDSTLTLRAGADRIEIETRVDNTVDDHRVRALFPTGSKASTFLADTPFDVVERPVALRRDNHTYKEQQVETTPQQSWTGIFDGKRGLAVVAAGLNEATVRDLPDRPLALTLFRGTRRTVFTDGEPQGQLRGPLTFRYWIVPLAGEPDRARLCELGQRINAGLRDAHVSQSAGGTLPASESFLSVEGAAVVTSARRVGDALEVRLFNPNLQSVTAAVRLSTPIRQAQAVDFESRPTGSAPVMDGAVKLTVKPKQIVTLRLV